jgi:hypothetical protein
LDYPFIACRRVPQPEEPAMLRHRSAFLLAPIVWLSAAGVTRADGLFSPDPQHAWNRLHRFFYVRTYSDGKTFAYDGLEAPLGRIGPFLTAGPSHKEALMLLDDFLKTDADKLVKDPLRRALMQRDLWYVFDKLAETTPETLEFSDEPDERQPQRRQVGHRLARIIHRLALTEKEIQDMPDNYATAVKSRAFPAAPDSKAPDRTFLPPDLLAPGSPWVLVDRGVPIRDRATPYLPAPAAFEHYRSVEGKAVFLVLLRLPGGRKEAEEYVARLRPDEAAMPLPAGAMFALVRQTVLVDDHGNPRATRLTEDLQLRSFPAAREQHNYEWTLDRKALLAGKTGGLRGLGPDDTELFPFGPTTASLDPFSLATPPQPERPLNRCSACHSREGGISSVNAFGSGRTEGWKGAARTDYVSQVYRTVTRKRLSYTWGLLHGMSEEPLPQSPH